MLQVAPAGKQSSIMPQKVASPRSCAGLQTAGGHDANAAAMCLQVGPSLTSIRVVLLWLRPCMLGSELAPPGATCRFPNRVLSSCRRIWRRLAMPSSTSASQHSQPNQQIPRKGSCPAAAKIWRPASHLHHSHIRGFDWVQQLASAARALDVSQK